jgi:beta-phosphoglucomutase
VLHLFGAVIVGSDILHPKPHPDPYQACVAALRLPPRVIAAVEDTPQGVASARAAGLIAIGITNSVPASSLRGAEAVISDFSEIPATLSRLARSVY